MQVWELCVLQVLLGLENCQIPDFAGNMLRKSIENLCYHIVIFIHSKF